MARSSSSSKGVLKKLGPGLVTGAADDDPAAWATYSRTGAQFGVGLLWTMALTYPLMSAINWSRPRSVASRARA